MATSIGGGIASQLLENADVQAKVIEGALALIQAFSEGGIAGAFDLVKEKAQPVIDLFNKHRELFTFVGIAIAVILVPALYAWAISAGAAAIATLGLTWPVLAIAVAVGALAASTRSNRLR